MSRHRHEQQWPHKITGQGRTGAEARPAQPLEHGRSLAEACSFVNATSLVSHQAARVSSLSLSFSPICLCCECCTAEKSLQLREMDGCIRLFYRKPATGSSKQLTQARARPIASKQERNQYWERSKHAFFSFETEQACFLRPSEDTGLGTDLAIAGPPTRRSKRWWEQLIKERFFSSLLTITWVGWERRRHVSRSGRFLRIFFSHAFSSF